MTDDIVARLREEADWRDRYAWSRLDGGQDYSLAASLANKAADEIERLRAALEQVETSVQHGLAHYKGAAAQKIAREVILIVHAALNGGKTND